MESINFLNNRNFYCYMNEVELFIQWEELFFAGLEAKNIDTKMFNQLCEYVNNINSKGLLPKKIQDQTNSFLNEFCPKIIDFILNASHNSDYSKLFNQIIVFMIPLYSKLITSDHQNFLSACEILSSRFYRSTLEYNSSKNQWISPYYLINYKKFIDYSPILSLISYFETVKLFLLLNLSFCSY